jgi:hypothetical protein
MRKDLFVLLAAIALISDAGLAVAQSTSGADQAKQSAPPQSSHASGHDAQAGRPETAPSPESARSISKKKNDIGKANTAITEEAKKQKK